jgi:hypothetical protein
MSVDIVRGELERLFSLDEMMALSADLLGLPPADVGGAASKASFARALIERCAELDAVDALVDAIVASRTEADARLRDLQSKRVAPAEELEPGETFGAFTIGKKLGESARSIVYSAKRDGVDRTLKVLRRAVSADRRAVQRFLTQVRLAARVTHENLPAELEAGVVDARAFVAYAPVHASRAPARST